MKKRYKFLRLVDGKIKSNSGDKTWEVGEWEHEERIDMCNLGFHCSKEINQAFSFVQGEILAEVEVKGKCENPQCWKVGNQLHHIFFKSQYFGKDRNTSWNLANICFDCHDLVHHTGKKEGAILNYYLKNKAYQEYTGSRKNELGLYVIRAHAKSK